MRTTFFLLILAVLVVPANAFASEAQLHGGWNLVAVAYGKQRVDVPPEINLHVAFDKAKKTWTFRTDYGEQATEVTGQYRLEGDQLYVSLQGQEAPPMTLAFVGQELHVQVALDSTPNAERYTFIAKRGPFKARPQPPPAKPEPAPTPRPTPSPAR